MGRVTKADYAALQEERDNLLDQLDACEAKVALVTAISNDQVNTIIALQERVESLENDLISASSYLNHLEEQLSLHDEELEELGDDFDQRIQDANNRVAFLGQTLLAIYRYEGDDPSVARVLALGALSDFVEPSQLA